MARTGLPRSCCARGEGAPRTLWVDGLTAALAAGALSATVVLQTVLDTVGAGMLALVRSHWLKGIGHAGASLPEAWLANGRASVLERTWFPRRPRMAPGDRLVYYAAGWRRIFAVVEVMGEPTDTAAHTTNPARWPWSVAVEPLLVIPHLENAPPVEAIGVAARSMSQQSHIRLSAEHYARAVEAIAGVAV